MTGSTQNRGGSRAAATSKMERFVIILNGFQPLTIITKLSILDVASALDPPLQNTKLVWNGLKTQGQISTKRCVDEYCSCDIACQLSALYRTYSAWLTVFGQTDKRWQIYRQIRLTLYTSNHMCLQINVLRRRKL